MESGIRFVLIPSGEFLRGTSQYSDCPDLDDAGPPRSVRISHPFYLGEFEVTQAQWLRAMGANPSRSQRGGEYPVENVSWNEVQEFLSRTATRLPSEAEWEYACRAGTDTSRYGPAEAIAWFYENTVAYWRDPVRYIPGIQFGPPPVGGKRPNRWGAHDMLGSVEEWCSDVYSPYPTGSDTLVDPTGPKSGDLRVVRGGSWWLNPDDLSAYRRNALPPDAATDEVGLRVARDL